MKSFQKLFGVASASCSSGTSIRSQQHPSVLADFLLLLLLLLLLILLLW
jgi:hypothetical protein